MIKPIPSIDDIALLFHVTPARVREQFWANLRDLEADLPIATRTGRKVRGMDAQKIQECIDTIKHQLGV